MEIEPNELEMYAVITDKIRVLEEERNQLKVGIMAWLRESPRVSTRWGVFALITKKAWAYTEAVTKATISLKALKETEEATGAATAVTTDYLQFTPEKEAFNDRAGMGRLSQPAI